MKILRMGRIGMNGQEAFTVQNLERHSQLRRGKGFLVGSAPLFIPIVPAELETALCFVLQEFCGVILPVPFGLSPLRRGVN